LSIFDLLSFRLIILEDFAGLISRAVYLFNEKKGICLVVKARKEKCLSSGPFVSLQLLMHRYAEMTCM
jgi:hypothetical protein